MGYLGVCQCQLSLSAGAGLLNAKLKGQDGDGMGMDRGTPLAKSHSTACTGNMGHEGRVKDKNASSHRSMQHMPRMPHVPTYTTDATCTTNIIYHMCPPHHIHHTCSTYHACHMYHTDSTSYTTHTTRSSDTTMQVEVLACCGLYKLMSKQYVALSTGIQYTHMGCLQSEKGRLSCCPCCITSPLKPGPIIRRGYCLARLH